jgi:hypothetical protein
MIQAGRTMPDVTLQPVSVMSDGGSHEGRLVFADADLVAVFARVSAEETAGNGRQAGGWFLEAGFGPCGALMTVTPPVFPTLEDAAQWVRARLGAGLSAS